MNEQEWFISTCDAPVYVCKRCGALLRILICGPQSRMQCYFCYNMTERTEYRLADDDGMLMYADDEESLEFQETLLREYVYNSEKFDKKAFDDRLRYLRRRRHFISNIL